MTAPTMTKTTTGVHRPHRRFVLDFDWTETSGRQRHINTTTPTPTPTAAARSSAIPTTPRTTISQRLRRAIVNDDVVAARRIAAHAAQLVDSATHAPLGPAVSRAWNIQRASLSREDCLQAGDGVDGTLRFSICNVGPAPPDTTLQHTHARKASSSSSTSPPQQDHLTGPFHLPSLALDTPAIQPAANSASTKHLNRPRPPFPRDSIEAEMDNSKSSLQLAIEYGCAIDMVDWLLDMGHERRAQDVRVTRDHLGRSIPHLAAIYNRPDVIALYCSHVHFLLTVPKIAQAAAIDPRKHAPVSRPVSPFGTTVDDEEEEGIDGGEDAILPGGKSNIKTNSRPPPSDGQTYIEELLDSFDSLAGRTALHDAALRGHEECVRLLLDLGASIDSADMLGNTPLHYASSYGHLTSVQLLIEKGGAQFTLKNDGGFSAADYAFTMGDRAALEAFGRKWVLDKKDKRRRKLERQRRRLQRRQERAKPGVGIGIGIEDEVERRGAVSSGDDDTDSDTSDADDGGIGGPRERLRRHHTTRSWDNAYEESDADSNGGDVASSDDARSTSSSPTRGFSFNTSSRSQTAHSHSHPHSPLPPSASVPGTLHRTLRSRTPDFLHGRASASADHPPPGPSLFRGASVRRAAAAAAQNAIHSSQHGHGHGHGHGLMHHLRDRAHQYGLSHLGHSGSAPSPSPLAPAKSTTTSGESLRDRFNLHRKGGTAVGPGGEGVVVYAPPPMSATQRAFPASTTRAAAPAPPPSAPLPRSRAGSSSSTMSVGSSSGIGLGLVGGSGSGTTTTTTTTARSKSQSHPLTHAHARPPVDTMEPNRADVAPWELVDPAYDGSGANGNGSGSATSGTNLTQPTIATQQQQPQQQAPTTSKQTDSSGSNDTIKATNASDTSRAKREKELADSLIKVLGGSPVGRKGSSGAA